MWDTSHNWQPYNDIHIDINNLYKQLVLTLRKEDKSTIKISNIGLYTFSWNIRPYNITQVNATIWRGDLIIHKIIICASVITNMWKYNIVTFISIES